MTPSGLPAAIVLPPLFGGLVVVLCALRHPGRARVLAMTAAAGSTAAAALALARCARGEVLTYAFGSWAAPFGIVYQVDALSAVMALLVAAVAVGVFLYAGPSVSAELPHQEPAFFATSSLLLAALLGMVVTGDLFNLYVFLEIASITAYTLIGAGGGAAALASLRYLILGTVGASFYLLGLAYLFAMTGTLNMADMAQRLPAVGDSPALLVALAFIVTGFGLKMAFFPLHAWLPDAYSYAPSAATAFLAAVMTKVNAFALLRVLYGVLWPSLAPLALPLAPLLGWAAAVAILAGSVMALAQTDIKRLLAYSSVSHLGYIGLGIALGNGNGLIGAMLHIVAHAITKCCLFLVAGGVEYRHGRAAASWSGLGRSMPISMAALTVAALSMIGVPPTAGFFGKWHLMLGSIEAGQPGFVIVLLLSSLLNAWYFFRLIERIYFTPSSDGEVELVGSAELPRTMLMPIVGFAAAILVVGLLSAPLARDLLAPAIAALPGRSAGAVAVNAESGHGGD